jgi:hypothetical protein
VFTACAAGDEIVCAITEEIVAYRVGGNCTQGDSDSSGSDLSEGGRGLFIHFGKYLPRKASIPSMSQSTSASDIRYTRRWSASNAPMPLREATSVAVPMKASGFIFNLAWQRRAVYGIV